MTQVFMEGCFISSVMNSLGKVGSIQVSLSRVRSCERQSPGKERGRISIPPKPFFFSTRSLPGERRVGVVSFVAFKTLWVSASMKREGGR